LKPFWLSLVVALIFPSATAANAKEILRVACFDFPRSFNPVYATNETAQAAVNRTHQSLFYFDRLGDIRPELVDSFSCSASGLEITLALKPGVRFSDGSHLGSRDIVATVALLKDPSFEYPYLSDLDFLDQVEAIGPLALRIRLKGKFAPWRNYLTFKILHAEEIRGFDPKKFRRHAPLGSGPYRLTAVDAPQGFAFAENPFWPRRLRFKKIVYSMLAEPRQAPLKLLNDEIDAVEIHGDDARTHAKLKKWRECFRLLSFKKFGFTYLVFNLRNRQLNANLRRTVFNRLFNTRFLDVFLEGSGDRVFSPFLRFGAAKRPRPFQTEPLTGRPRLKILTNSESVTRKQLVLFLCEEMKACGIELEPVFVEYQSFLQYLKQGHFDLAVSAFLLDMDWNMKDILSSSGYFNYARYSDPRMDAVLEDGLREMDEDQRRKKYDRAHELWLEALPLIPLFSLNYYMGVTRQIAVPGKRVEVIGSCGDFFGDIQDW